MNLQLRNRGIRFLAPLAALVVVLAVWEGVVYVFQVPRILLPAPSQICRVAIERAGDLGACSLVTASTAFAGLAISIVLGTLIAMIFSQSRLLRTSLYPYAIFLQTVPIVAIAPIIIIWLGEGTLAVTVITTIIGLFPIITNGTSGMTTVSRELQDLFRLNQATRWQTLWKLQLPHSLPSLVTGARISAGLAVLGSIVGEYFAGAGSSRAGLGYLIYASQSQFKIDLLFAAVISCTILGVVIFSVVSWIGTNGLLRWQQTD